MNSTTSENRESLRFFGQVSASVSHEIKNVLAVINEAAGLIDDFTLMVEKGMPLDPDRLKRAVKSIQGQVQRGDGIIKNINSLAHSTDEEDQETDLVKTLELITALSTRMADMKQVGIEVGECEPVAFRVNPFGLMRLLHAAIAEALNVMSKGNVLAMAVRPASDGAMFTLSVSGQAVSLAPSEKLSILARETGATIMDIEEEGVLELHLRRLS